ncbi:syntaxin-81 isoform X2 [Cryptomeria japonica]|uniref:syntaxin-81 isoform X2 n=1 Tax=Cryptomeria japonica TaxID=3369 RepID=UPI0025ABEF5B|nr:syntaxin-81 isoform X2 [Cryptomeria japonica]
MIEDQNHSSQTRTRRVLGKPQIFNSAKMAKISASLILRRPLQKSQFIKSALKTLESIRTLETFVLDHRKDYVDRHRTTEQDRDSIEHEVQVFVKACREQIEILKNSVQIENKRGRSVSWIDGQEEVGNADIIAHKHGVMLILSERLHAVTALFDQLRAARFQEAIDKTIPRRARNFQSKNNSLKTSVGDYMNGIEVTQHNVQAEQQGNQQQLLDEETQALQVELTNLLDTVQETERKVIEMSALNHLLSTHVLHQAQQIELLYEQAIEATQNVDKGNKELAKAIQRNSSSRTFLLLFLVVLPLALLFLDWYQ